MSMEWSFNDAEVLEEARDILESTWTREQLVSALVESDCDSFVSTYADELDAFCAEREHFYNQEFFDSYLFQTDQLVTLVLEKAEKLRTCSNNFSKLYIDEKGYHTIVLP